MSIIRSRAFAAAIAGLALAISLNGCTGSTTSDEQKGAFLSSYDTFTSAGAEVMALFPDQQWSVAQLVVWCAEKGGASVQFQMDTEHAYDDTLPGAEDQVSYEEQARTLGQIVELMEKRWAEVRPSLQPDKSRSSATFNTGMYDDGHFKVEMDLKGVKIQSASACTPGNRDDLEATLSDRQVPWADMSFDQPVNEKGWRIPDSED